MHPPFFQPVEFRIILIVLRFLLFFGGAFLLLWYYLKNSNKVIVTDPAGDDRKVILPLRLQAFERFVLFLERIRPSNLLMRLSSSGLTAAQLQSLLVKTIREEFDYNLSQQLYISPALWELIKNAKEEMISLINQATEKVGQEAPSAGLVKEILDQVLAKGKLPVDTAIDEVKGEMKKML